jgi:hypothetical protein
MKEIYSPHITDPSLKELEDFALWYNEKLGNHPIIVGGWAVYCYSKGLGSKDIDVVFLGDKTKHVTLYTYFLSHGFVERSRSMFDKEFVKLIKTKDTEVEIIIDAVSSNRFIAFEGRDARIPWNWAVKNSIEYKIGKSTIYIPTVDLLLVYKLGAILGRNTYVRAGIDINYYKSKLWKDVHDVISLSKLDMNSEKFNKFMIESGLSKYKGEILQIIEDNFDNELKSLLKEDSIKRIKIILEK